jgi:hypothetical protein
LLERIEPARACADLHDAITNIVEGDTGNSVAIRNPARTGALRVTANQRRVEPPRTTAKHYFAKTINTRNYYYMFLYALSIVASIAYFAIRIVYIAEGRFSVRIPLNVVVDRPGGGKDEVGDLLNEAGFDIDPYENDEITESMLDHPLLAGVKGIVERSTYSYWWSCCVLAAEIGGFILVHVSQQMFVRQDTKFYEMPPERVAQLREVCPARAASLAI